MEIEISKHDFSIFVSNAEKGSDEAGWHATVDRVREGVLHDMLWERDEAGDEEKSHETEISNSKSSRKMHYFLILAHATMESHWLPPVHIMNQDSVHRIA